ncbi:ABC transporter substrate-binding protein [Salinadaptatus halalkaliphilus]|uniref:ABC transporter substrate-binding protein n=1 Tax=Salinadaptatus halalkaliphilus TaxID=2419781 RepID=A0A4S3TIX3_9EURY|nr:ABC transporter substrate-binding protein [Salinadaptatus halalkaliphilus]THE63916.1 ABC transporter substrate-binding protein [Salinadaptatus halalkaliphilus]
MTNASQGTASLEAARHTVRTRPNRRHVLGAVAGTSIGSLAGCLETYETVAGSADETEETITIGVLAADPDGDYLGQSIVRSVRLAVDQLNEEDGIGGAPVELAVGDTNGNPLEGRREYQRLVLEEGADVTIGVGTSEVLVELAQDIAEQETVHITAGAATTAITDLVRDQYDQYKYHFRAGPVNEYDLGEAQIDFLQEMAPELGWESIALLAEDYSWSEGSWETFQEQRADLPLDIAVEQRYPPATNDFGAIYDEAEAADIDSVFISTAHTGTDAVLDWAGQRPFGFGGIHVPLQLPTYYEATNGACRYAIGQSSAPLGPDVTPESEALRTAYQDAYGESTPVYTGYFAYDATMVFAQAVEQTSTDGSTVMPEADDLVETLEEIEVAGSSGTIEFHDRDGEYPHDLIYREGDTFYFQWQEQDGEGVQEIIWPEEYATAEYVPPAWL